VPLPGVELDRGVETIRTKVQKRKGKKRILGVSRIKETFGRREA